MILYNRFIVSILFIAVLFKSAAGEHLCNIDQDDFYAAQIILFFAPMGTSSAIRQQIVIYYHNPGFRRGDTVALFRGDNVINKVRRITSFDPTEKKGIWKTAIRPENLLYDVHSINKTVCLGYFGAWLRNGTMKKLNCLSSYPNWMGERKEMLKNLRIQDVFIPGTHNSGSYSEDEPQSLGQQFTVTQDHDVYQQLMAGARYIDLRPSYYGEYWVNHGESHRMNKMDDIVSDVKQFMDSNNEIVIVSVREFPFGFRGIEQHRHFIKYLENSFAGYLVSRQPRFGWNITLGQIWLTGKRLILSYDHDAFLTSYEMWYPIPQNWANVQNLLDLKIHLVRTEVTHRFPVASMAAITLNGWTAAASIPEHIIGTDTNSLRRLAAQAGQNLTTWYFELFYSCANIVAVDYIDATGIVAVAIEWNERRVSPCFPKFRKLMDIDPACP